MAKTNHVKVNAFQIDLEYKTAESCNLKIKGNNTSGTEVVVNVDLCDWQFAGIIKQMAAMGRRRVRHANDRMKSITDAVNPD